MGDRGERAQLAWSRVALQSTALRVQKTSAAESIESYVSGSVEVALVEFAVAVLRPLSKVHFPSHSRLRGLSAALTSEAQQLSALCAQPATRAVRGRSAAVPSAVRRLPSRTSNSLQRPDRSQLAAAALLAVAKRRLYPRYGRLA